MMQNLFDDIRPYYADEIPAAMSRIADDELFGRLAQFVFPDKRPEEVGEMVRKIRTTDEFQKKVMYYANLNIIDRSITELTYDGLEWLDPAKNYLFVSNHRDIMLDSSLLQFILYTNGFRTTEITFGSNLMHPQLAVDIGKSNKMFKVERSSNIRDFIRNSMHLSEYIRYTIREKGESVWIAQRNGRTKDGNDVTDQGIIKMFCMSANNPADGIDELNIAPVAVSYQIEPCDMLKAKELYLTQCNGSYTKQPGEDLHSILAGVMQPKGRVHISVCEPLRRDELAGDFKYPNEFYKAVAALIDKRIYKHYKLFSQNYMAHNILAGIKDCNDYTSEELDAFINHCSDAAKQIDGDKDRIWNILLSIYARPVDNASAINV